MRLAHGWTLERLSKSALVSAAGKLVREAVRSVPESMAERIGRVHIRLWDALEDSDITSRWARTAEAVEIDLATEGTTAHDCALEFLTCLGQILWEKATKAERDAWLRVLQAEFEGGVSGEIDEESLRLKRLLLSGRAMASSPRQLARYAGAAFAGTAAEYVHCLWHDVTLRHGAEFLEWKWLRRRLALFEQWFPAIPRLAARVETCPPEETGRLRRPQR